MVSENHLLLLVKNESNGSISFFDSSFFWLVDFLLFLIKYKYHQVKQIMINLLVYLTTILAEETKAKAPTSGTIGFSIPSFSLEGNGLIYSIIIFFECLGFITFVLFPKKHLAGFQTQALIFQGIFFGVDHVLTSSLLGFGESLFFYIALIAAPIAAILSVNDKFKNLFLCLINAYGTTYLLCLIIRMKFLYCVISGIALYFLFLLLIKKYEVLESCLGKIYTTTLSAILLIDIWGYWSIMKPLHGASDSTLSLVMAITLGAGFFCCAAALVILPVYYEEWTKKKLGKIQGGGEETSQPKAEAA